MNKRFMFVVTLVTGATLFQMGEGRNIDCALMDACERMAMSGEYPEEDIASIELSKNMNNEKL